MSADSMDSTIKLVSNVILIDKERVCGHLDWIVRSSVEKTLNVMLDSEADRLVGADCYQCTYAVGPKMGAADVLEALYLLLLKYEKTEIIRSDNVLYTERIVN